MAERADDIQERLDRTDSIIETTTILAQIDQSVVAGDMSVDDGSSLRYDAYSTLQRLTSENAAHAQDLILRFLLPRVIDGTIVPSEEPYTLRRYRELLVDWINQYADNQRNQLLARILDTLHTALKQNASEKICYTIAVLGFRRDDIVVELWNLIEKHDDELGDIALSALTSLGVLPSDRPRILASLNKRVPKRRNSQLLGALRRLAEPASLPLVRDYWLATDSSPSVTWETSSIFRIFSDVADHFQAHAEIQEQIWEMLRSIFEAHPSSLEFLYANDTLTRCDSAEVVKFLLSHLEQEAGDEKRPAGNRHLLYRRLEECVRPRQLGGWAQPIAPNLIAPLTLDAQRDTRAKGYFTTQEMRLKEAAWNTLLGLRYSEVLSWFDTAVTPETNMFVQQQLSQWLASFHLAPIPPTVLRWITEPYDHQKSNQTPEWAPRMAAIQIARSAATIDGFEALRNFGFTFEGAVLQESVDALAEVAVILARSGVTTSVDSLIDTLTAASPLKNQIAAAAALEIIGTHGLLTDGNMRELEALVLDDDLDLAVRGNLVGALGFSAPPQLSVEVQGQLLTWAQQEGPLTRRSLEALARLGTLLGLPDLLQGRLLLRHEATVWTLSNSTLTLEWAPYIIGLLYLKDSASFMPAVTGIIELGDWSSVVQILNMVNLARGSEDSQSVPRPVKEALVDRTKRFQTAAFAEISLFSALVRLAPDELAAHAWEREWNDWMPDSRAALANAIGETSEGGTLAGKRLAMLLLGLTGDGQYAVRRAAYRALSRQWPERLKETCGAWSIAALVDVRERAAEACAWLPETTEYLPTFKQVSERLSMDPERRVREVMKRELEYRRKRQWATAYLGVIRDRTGSSNEDILAVWPYGRALTQIGDDSSIQDLRAYLAEQTQPHVRHWLRTVIQDTEKSWRKATREWPEPWLEWEGAVEEGQGVVFSSDGSESEARYSLWQSPAPTPGAKTAWGGAVWVAPGRLTLSESGFSLQLSDGRSGRGLATSIRGEEVIFVGMDSYPAHG